MSFRDQAFGRETDKHKLIELLLAEECRHQLVSLVSVVGVAGAGKTTLAHLVYTDPSICNRFEARVWIRMPWINDIAGLFRTVVGSLTGVHCSLADFGDLLESAKEKLKGKRLLLVLDNYCKDDERFVSDLFDGFSQLELCTKGNIVLFTTTKTIVSTGGHCTSFLLNPLSEDDCRMILQACVTDAAADVGKLIPAACNGSPLSATLLGALLHFTTVDRLSLHLENAMQRQEQDESEKSILLALELSLHFLPKHLRECFLYLSLFPKDHLFEKDHVIQLWMSQGLIEPRCGEKAEETGNKYFDELLLRSFFQSSPIPDTPRIYYQMHDLVHDFALSISGKEVLQLKGGSKAFSSSDSLRHMSLVATEFNHAIDVELLKERSSLRSLLVIGRFDLDWTAPRIRIQNPESLNDLFVNLACLKTLDLSFSNIKELPSTIQNLEDLRYLGLNYTYIKKLPESLCTLSKLQTLGLHNCTYLEELPKDMNNLVGLRSLDIWKDTGFISTPQGIGCLTDLQVLTAFHVGEASIAELKGLVNLRGKLNIGGLNCVSSGKDAMEANLIHKTGLRNLILKWAEYEWESDGDLEQGTACEVFENLQPCINLEQLTVQVYPGVKFPSWFGSTLFSELTSVTLDNCYQSVVLPVLGQLPSLKYLLIRKMDRVQRVGREFCGPDKNAFPSLEILKIYELYHLEEWSGVEDGDFARLQSLSISRCYKLKFLPCFQSLNELSLHSCTQLLELPYFSSLKSLSIADFQTMKTLILPIQLSSLQKLQVKYCKQLLHLEGFSGMVCLKELSLAKCPKLHLEQSEEQLPLELELIKIDHTCDLLMAWCPPDFYQDSEVNQVFQRRLIRKDVLRTSKFDEGQTDLLKRKRDMELIRESEIEESGKKRLKNSTEK